MSDTIFDLYQTKGLLPSIGGSDEIYKNLMEAAKAIAEDLKKSPAKIPIFALVAIDNQIQENEPVLEVVERSIKSKWKMLRSFFAEMPIVLYRVIILRALELLAKEDNDSKFTFIVYLSLIDIYSCTCFSHQEHELITFFIQKSRKYVDGIINEKWSAPKSKVNLSIPDVIVSIPARYVEIDENILKNSIYTSKGSAAYSGLDPTWVDAFYKKMLPGMTEILNDAFAESGINEEDAAIIEKQLNEGFLTIKNILKDALYYSVQASISIEQKSQLMWWKEALYSGKLHKSYRKLTKFECTIAMSVELNQMLPDVFPASVDYLLREAFWAIYGFDDNEITMIEFLDQVNANQNASFLKTYLEQPKESTGRTDLVSFMQRIIYAKTDIQTEIIPSIGIQPDRKISYEDISVWILHCCALKRLTSKQTHGK